MSQSALSSTIFAKSSGAGIAGIAVFRLSGPTSLEVLNKLLKESASQQFIPQKMYYKKFYVPNTGELIDEGMVVYFKAPTSFTGEDVVELHLHGSIAIYKLLMNAVLSIKQVRMAEPGEFAKRAFLNGKFDLTAAEGLADLIDAETELQHKQALKQRSGALASLYNSWREQLLKIIALLEAYIDFPEEEISEVILNQAKGVVSELKSTIKSHLTDNKRGERLRSGIKLSILGEPNVGKSTLLNKLLQREAAIVSNIAGTTRDIIEGHIDIGGYPIIIQDTAGIRYDSLDVIEQEGITRSLAAIKNADIKIILFDINQNSQKLYIDNIRQYIDDNTILVVNKVDLALDYQEQIIFGQIPLYLSLKQNLGMDKLYFRIVQMAEKLAGLREAPVITRERHRQKLENALELLNNFSINGDLVLATEDIRLTIRALSSITGVITVEEILGEIFSRFCIGK